MAVFSAFHAREGKDIPCIRRKNPITECHEKNFDSPCAHGSQYPEFTERHARVHHQKIYEIQCRKGIECSRDSRHDQHNNRDFREIFHETGACRLQTDIIVLCPFFPKGRLPRSALSFAASILPPLPVASIPVNE